MTPKTEYLSLLAGVVCAFLMFKCYNDAQHRALDFPKPIPVVHQDRPEDSCRTCKVIRDWGFKNAVKHRPQRNY